MVAGECHNPNLKTKQVLFFCSKSGFNWYLFPEVLTCVLLDGREMYYACRWKVCWFLNNTVIGEIGEEIAVVFTEHNRKASRRPRQRGSLAQITEDGSQNWIKTYKKCHFATEMISEVNLLSSHQAGMSCTNITWPCHNNSWLNSNNE